MQPLAHPPPGATRDLQHVHLYQSLEPLDRVPDQHLRRLRGVSRGPGRRGLHVLEYDGGAQEEQAGLAGWAGAAGAAEEIGEPGEQGGQEADYPLPE